MKKDKPELPTPSAGQLDPVLSVSIAMPVSLLSRLKARGGCVSREVRRMIEDALAREGGA